MENTNKGETFQTTQSMGLTEMRKQRDELQARLEKDQKDGKNIYNLERSIGDLNELINAHPQSGCGETFRVSQLTNETFVCGKNKLNGKTWLCNDCLDKQPEEHKKFFKYEDEQGNLCYKQNSFNFDKHKTVDAGVELQERATKLTEREINFCLETLPNAWSRLSKELQKEVDILKKKLHKMKEGFN